MISVSYYVEKAVWLQFNLKYVRIYTRSKKKTLEADRPNLNNSYLWAKISWVILFCVLFCIPNTPYWPQIKLWNSYLENEINLSDT